MGQFLDDRALAVGEGEDLRRRPKRTARGSWRSWTSTIPRGWCAMRFGTGWSSP